MPSATSACVAISRLRIRRPVSQEFAELSFTAMKVLPLPHRRKLRLILLTTFVYISFILHTDVSCKVVIGPSRVSIYDALFLA